MLACLETHASTGIMSRKYALLSLSPFPLIASPSQKQVTNKHMETHTHTHTHTHGNTKLQVVHAELGWKIM